MSDIKGISPSYCTHKILMEDDFKPVIQPQRRLNQKVQDVVKNDIVKLLDSGLIYPISDSLWVSLIHVVPKKGGMSVVLNDNNELIPSRTVTRWRVCIDYPKLNDATQKDHFPLPFIDQMLERLCGNEYYCYLDAFLGFFQIPITPEDQEKTTFICPYGTFAYRRMPFGLCNAPTTFQRCMTAIFQDMVEDFMEVFMDDFSVFDAKDYVMRCDACQRSGNISSRSEIPQNNIQLEEALQKYGVTHKLSTTYNLQTNRQTKVTNRAIKRILERSVGYNPKNWSKKLDDALWAFRTAYKMPIGCTLFRLVYGKACHLPVEIEHKAYWVLKQCNMDLTAAAKNCFMELNELMELRDDAYENTRIYKERTKKWHDSRLRGDQDFKVGDLVLLFNSRFKMHSGKLKSRWYDPNVVKTVYLYGTVEITDKNGVSFKVNGQRLKKYHERHIDTKDKEVVEFEEDTT
ncbi:reverse transcriptase domain-containing protein [Tanacetum coccineum]